MKHLLTVLTSATVVAASLMLTAQPALAGKGTPADELVNAAARGEADTVAALLTQGANVNATNSKGHSALMEAARTGREPVVKALLAAGADPNLRGKDGWTAAMRAVMGAQAGTLRLLADAGADLNLKNDKGETAFFWAVGNGAANSRPELIEILAKGGVGVDAQTVRGKPALIYAVNSLQDNVVKGMMAAGASAGVKDEKGRPALVLAAQHGNLASGVNMVALLAAGGADVNARDAEGRTAIEHAANVLAATYSAAEERDNNGKVIYILASKGADERSIAAARSIILKKGYALYDTLIVRGQQKAAGAAQTTPAGASATPPERSAKPPDGCPPQSTVSHIDSSSPQFTAAQPIDLTGIRAAKALVQTDGTSLKVFLANRPYSAAQMNSDMVIPVKNPGEAVLVLKFMNGQDKVASGEYTPAAGYGKPHSVTAEVQVPAAPSGVVISMVTASSRDSGSATISHIGDGWVCGRFDLKGQLGNVTGAFAAAVE